MTSMRDVVYRPLIILVVAALMGGCSAPADEGETPGARADADFTDAASESAEEAAQLHQQTLDIIKLASADYTLDLTREPAPEAAIAPVTEGLIDLADRQNRALADSYGFIDLLAVSEGVEQQQLARARQPLLFTATVTLAGVFLTGYVAKKQIDKAIDERTAPTRGKLVEGSDAELDIAREEMGLPSDADREAILDAFDGADSSKQLTFSKNIEAALAVAVTNNTPDVDNVDTMELRKAVSKSSVTLGETAVNTTVSVATTATGGQGTTQAFQAVGMSERAAQAADLAVSVVSVATGEPLQPLDQFASKMTVTAVSEEKRTVEVPEPDVDMTVDEAIEILNGSGAVKGAAHSAAATLFRDGASKLGAVVDEMPDGTLEVEVPARVHRTVVEDVNNQTTFSLPDFGLMDIVITATDQMPQLFEGIDLSVTSAVEFATDTGDEDEPDDPGNNGVDTYEPVTCEAYYRTCSEPGELESNLYWCEHNMSGIERAGCLDEYEAWLGCSVVESCSLVWPCSSERQAYNDCWE